MNAEYRDDWELSDGEASLERELRELQPWSPSPRLRCRIEAEAVRPVGAEGPRKDKPEVRRFPAIPVRHAFAAVAAAAAVVALAVAPFWFPANQSGRGLAGAETASRSASPSSDEGGQDELILWDRVPGTQQPADWRRDEYLIGRQSVGVVNPPQGRPMWQVRYRMLTRTSWKDQDTGAVREHYVPEERVLFVPVRHD